MCVCFLLMNEGRWSSDSDLQNEAGFTRVPDWNQNQLQSRMLEEEEEEVQEDHTCLHHDFHHDLTNNNKAGDEEEEEEGEEGEVGGSKMEEDDEEMDSTSGACSPELTRDSSLSCSPSVCEGSLSPEEIPVGVFSPHDLRHNVSDSLRVLEERGDDAALPHHLHQIAECLMQKEDYERAIHFLQLERLYHERVLSNIAALQEAWENRWRCRRSVDNSLPHCNTEHLDKLKHICMTHRQPTWCSDTLELIHRISVNGETCEETNITSGSPCKSGMLEQDEVSPSESGTDCLAHQREPSCLCDSASSPLISSSQAPPTLIMTESSSAAVREQEEKPCEREQERERDKEPETQTSPQSVGQKVESTGGGKKAEPGGGGMESGPERGKMEAEPVEYNPVSEERMKGGVDTMSHTEKYKEAKKQEEEEEIEEAVEALEMEEELQRPEDAMLDDLAKLIQVEEITPASGLVSILKKRVTDGADDNSSTNKPLTKRRVRFHVPENGLDHDEVGGDSWLLLLLLCLVTVVISVGGTALYCAFGDAHSSVCTDFSHNIDFYMGKVQTSVEDITHFFSSSSS